MLTRLMPDPFVETVNVALVPLPLVLDWAIFENVDAPVAVPLVVAAAIPERLFPQQMQLLLQKPVNCLMATLL